MGGTFNNETSALSINGLKNIMSEVVKPEAVENKDSNAAKSQDGVKQSDGVAQTPPIASAPMQEDPEAKLAALMEENEKLSRERDNYRKGLLKAKGKLPEADEDDDESLSLSEPSKLNALIESKVREQLLATESEKAKAQVAEYAKKLARENKELKLALANKPSLATASIGTGEGGLPEPKLNFFSDEQLNELKKKGWDDAKIKRFQQTYLKIKG